MRKGLVFGVLAGLVVLAVYTASAHMGSGYSYGMPGMMGMGYGMGSPMMGYGYGYNADESPATTVQPEVKEVSEVSGKLSTVYPMGIMLDNGKLVILPWWFAANLGLKQGDLITVKGFEYGTQIVPVSIAYNGEVVGNENSGIPVWMQEYGGYSPWYGYGYGMGYGHCPMMGW